MGPLQEQGLAGVAQPVRFMVMGAMGAMLAGVPEVVQVSEAVMAGYQPLLEAAQVGEGQATQEEPHTLQATKAQAAARLRRVQLARPRPCPAVEQAWPQQAVLLRVVVAQAHTRRSLFFASLRLAY